MCLAMPARIVEISEDGLNGVVDSGGIRKTISLALLKQPSVDEYVLVHVGYAISTIKAEEARKTLALFAAAGMGGAPTAGEDK
jgi:hydrogenase expression/formation protein HypC